MDESVTVDGLTVQSTELLPRSDEFEAVLATIRVPENTACIGISVLKPWSTDRVGFDVLRDASEKKEPIQLFYRPSPAIDYYDVLQYGFPPGREEETWIEGPLTVEGGTVFSEEPPAMNSEAPMAHTVMVCDFLPGNNVFDCVERNASIVSEAMLREAGCDSANHGVVWATYGHGRALPKYLLRLAPKLASVQVNASFYDKIFASPVDLSIVHVTEHLKKAIEDAVDGATLILEGSFRETIVLEGKSLRLVGDGNRSIIKAPADEGDHRPTAVVRMAGAHRFVLSGITILANKRRDFSKTVADPAWLDCNPDVKKKIDKKLLNAAPAPLMDQGRCANCLEVTEGVEHAYVENCILLGGTEVSGGSQAYFKDSQLMNGMVNGMYATGSKLLMENCVIARHDSANVAVENCEEAIFLGCTIFASRSTGVYLFNKACPVFDQCDVFANHQTGIQMEGVGTNPIIRQCRFHHGEQYGIFVTTEATGIIEQNHFYANVWAAIAITEKGNSIFRENSVFRGRHYGVYMFDNGLGRIMNNFIHNNKDAGIAVASGAAPDIQKNEIYSGHSYGIYFFLSGMGRVEGNKVCAHHAANVCITYASDPYIVRNRIYSGETEGVAVMQEGKGQVEENEIFSNYEANVSIQYSGDPIVRKNKIYNSKKTGVCAMHRAKGQVVDNDIFGSEYSGVAIKTSSETVVRGNHIHDNRRYAVLVQMKGRGTVTGNRFGPNSMGSVRVWGDSFPCIKDNAFLDAEEKEDTKLEREGKPVEEDDTGNLVTPEPTSEGAESKSGLSFLDQLALTGDQLDPDADSLARNYLPPSKVAPPPIPSAGSPFSTSKKAVKGKRKKAGAAPQRVPPPPPPRNSDLIPGEQYEPATGLNGI